MQTTAIAAAQALWRARGAPQLGIAAHGNVPLHFATASPFDHGYYDPAAAAIYINDDLSDPDTMAIVIAHEIGHAFGLVHVAASVRASLMNPGNLDVQPTTDDQRALEALWGSCSAGS